MERFRHKLMTFLGLATALPPSKTRIADSELSYSRRSRCRHSTKDQRKGRKRLRMPSCFPGTITYRDWLVRHVGYDRRLADRMLAAWREDSSIRMPLPSDSETLKRYLV